MKSAGENPSVLGFIASNQPVYTLGLDTKHLVDNGLPIPLLRTQEQVEMATRAVIATLQGLLLDRVAAFTTFSNSLSLSHHYGVSRKTLQHDSNSNRWAWFYF